MLDKNPEMSGTWYENTYPGCQVDTANHLYSYIFEPNHQWSAHFSGSAELYAYFNKIVDKYELRQHVRLNTPVHRASFDEASNQWLVEIESDGKRETLVANSLISAVGQLNSPKMHDLEGLDSFTGTAFHSARWEHEHALEGKRVIVIGTGCSAAQFVPEIAPRCGDLKVFQRSAPWLLPTENYHHRMTPEELWLFQEVPFYARWYRFFLFRTAAADGPLPLLYADADWQGPPGTIGEGNEMLRAAIIESLTEQAGDDKELLAKLIPDYPPGGKRPVLDDGSWVTTMKRDNVQLLTDEIARVVPQGVEMADGIIFFVECQLRYVLGCLKLQLEQGYRSLECKHDVMVSYNNHIDELNSQRAWGHASVSSWYKNSAGRVTQNWPGTHGEWWQQTLAPDPADFQLD